MKKIKVFVIDDHAVVRLGLKLAFKLSPEMEFVGELAPGRNARVRVGGRAFDGRAVRRHAGGHLTENVNVV